MPGGTKAPIGEAVVRCDKSAMADAKAGSKVCLSNMLVSQSCAIRSELGRVEADIQTPDSQDGKKGVWASCMCVCKRERGGERDWDTRFGGDSGGEVMNLEKSMNNWKLSEEKSRGWLVIWGRDEEPFLIKRLLNQEQRQERTKDGV